MVRTITRDEVYTQLAHGEPLVLVEALPVMHYADIHLPGALNLPPDQLDRLVPTLLPDKTAAIAVYCSNRACMSSHRVAQRLEQLGYTNVAVYQAGKQDWIAAGLPIEQGVVLLLEAGI